jgi:iron(III) transport system substrate-binding protein
MTQLFKKLRLKKTLAISVIALVGVSLSGCSPADQDLQDATLTIYSGRNEDLVQQVIDDFSAETGIAVEVRYAGGAELAAQILEEGENSPADIFFSQDAGALGSLSKAGLLKAIPQELLGLVPSAYSAQDGNWVGISGRIRVLNYNPEKVTELPNSVFDLAEPKWQGRIGIAPTNASFQSFVTAMRVVEGEEKTLEWLKAMKTNAVLFEKNGAILEAVETGVVDAGLINHYYWYAKGKEVGMENMKSRITQFKDQDVGNLINVAGVGMVNDSASAKRFVEYLLSQNAQEYFASQTSEYPLIAGVPQVISLPALEEVPAPKIDLSDLDSLSETLDLIREAGLI